MTKLTMIPHDGGPCPVELRKKCDFLIKYRDGIVEYVKWQYVVPTRYDWTWKNRYNGIEYEDDIIAYCPIEIKEAGR